MAFIPEFDLCKFHMRLLEARVDVRLGKYADMVAKSADLKAAAVLGSLRPTYPSVLARLLNRAFPRRAQETMDLVAKAVRAMSLMD
ncbi:MAG: hypothetical protein ACE37K_15700 [Planctomycetota bacterium]